MPRALPCKILRIPVFPEYAARPPLEQTDKLPKAIDQGPISPLVRMRRNPASQTIILDLSQCRSAVSGTAFAGIAPRSYSPQRFSDKCQSPMMALDTDDARFRHEICDDRVTDSPQSARKQLSWPPSRRRHCSIIPRSGILQIEQRSQCCQTHCRDH